MKQALLFAILALPLLVGNAVSQSTVSFDVEVTTTEGPHASLFPAGERLLITYSLDPAAVDSNPDLARGIYNNAVLSVSVSFPGLSISANTGSAGLAQTFNDVGTCKISDQVFIHGGPIISATPLGGENVDSVEVDFLSDFLDTPGRPFMLSNDALPLSTLNFKEAFVLFRTANGNTYVHFQHHPSARVTTLSFDIDRLQAVGILNASQADRLRSELSAARSSFERGNNRQGAENLKDFIDRVNDLIDEGVLSPGAGQRLIDTAREIRRQVGF
ncbi:MAG TPA: hypothetical protein VJV05_00485 [Pyrinomonadaceae bacterium]|nr:hypothetical protein [Pyrinomonadaceae bacterium]